MFTIKKKRNAKETRLIEQLNADLERQKAITEYVAMMADVEIPIEEDAVYEQDV